MTQSEHLYEAGWKKVEESSSRMGEKRAGEGKSASIGLGKILKDRSFLISGIVAAALSVGALVFQARRKNRFFSGKLGEKAEGAKELARAGKERAASTIGQASQVGEEVAEGVRRVAEADMEKAKEGLATLEEVTPEDLKNELEKIAGEAEENLQRDWDLAQGQESVVSEKASGKYNLNEVGFEDLTQLPGIGEYVAIKIIDYRNVHGPIRSFLELRNIEDLDEQTLTRLEEICFLEGPEGKP